MAVPTWQGPGPHGCAAVATGVGSLVIRRAGVGMNSCLVGRKGGGDGKEGGGPGAGAGKGDAGGGREGRTRRSSQGDGSSLLVRAVIELARGNRFRGTAEISGREGGEEAGDGGGGESSAWEDDGPPMVGGHAADALASALCLSPHRVANGLGPIAPPSFAPEVFFPSVCHAVVEAVLACFEEAPTIGLGGGVRGGGAGDRRGGEGGGGEEGGRGEEGLGGGSGHVAIEQRAEGKGGTKGTPPPPPLLSASIPQRNAGANVALVDVDVDVDVVGDVWRAFSGRLLTAGRASDLADAWLQVMTDERTEEDDEEGAESPPPPPPKEQSSMVMSSVPVPAEAAAAAAGLRGRRGSAGGDLKSRSVGEQGEEAPAAVAARWEAWADRPAGAPEVHAWMMTHLPASRRKAFTEAVLRALWPRTGHHRQQRQGRMLKARFSVDGFPPGFQTAACRVLVGRPLVGAQRPTTRRRRRRTTRGGSGGGSAGGGGDGGGARELGLEGSRVAATAVGTIDGEELLSLSGAWVGEDRHGSVDVSVSLLEGLLLQRPLPPPAAEAIADTLAWCDRRRRGHGATTAATVAAVTVAEAYTSRLAGGAGGGAGRGGSGGVGAEGGKGDGLVMGALKRVAAVWAEPSFLNRSPPRQQEFYTRFLLAALRRCVSL